MYADGCLRVCVRGYNVQAKYDELHNQINIYWRDVLGKSTIKASIDRRKLMSQCTNCWINLCCVPPNVCFNTWIGKVLKQNLQSFILIY